MLKASLGGLMTIYSSRWVFIRRELKILISSSRFFGAVVRLTLLSKVNFTFFALDRNRDFSGMTQIVHHDIEALLQNVISKFDLTFVAPNRNTICSDIRGVFPRFPNQSH
jgi:hypothetical protein